MIPSSDPLPTLTFPSQIPHTPYSHPVLGINIHTYVKFQVTAGGVNFSKWRQLLKLLLTMYGVMDHVTEGATPRNPDDAWLAVDIHLRLWFVATLTDDLYRLVQGDGTACSIWTRLHRFFLADQTSRYLFLSKAFRSTPRGDMPISTYASKLQSIADDLDAIGRPVDDRDLASQFIDGLGIRKFTRDNYVSIEFDPFGFSVKDLATKTLLHRSNSAGDLYPFVGSTATSHAAFITSSGDL
jgi:hypothetical protein